MTAANGSIRNLIAVIRIRLTRTGVRRPLQDGPGFSSSDHRRCLPIGGLHSRRCKRPSALRRYVADEAIERRAILALGKYPIRSYLPKVFGIVRYYRSPDKLERTPFCCHNVTEHEGAILENT
jgi:hypothetical protein